MAVASSGSDDSARQRRRGRVGARRRLVLRSRRARRARLLLAGGAQTVARVRAGHAGRAPAEAVIAYAGRAALPWSLKSSLSGEQAESLAGAVSLQAAHLSSGPSLALALRRPAAHGVFASLKGPDEIQEAVNAAPYSLRALYASDNIRNACVAPSAGAGADAEVRRFFPELFTTGTTLALITPDAAAHIDEIIDAIGAAGLVVVADDLVHIPVEASAALKLRSGMAAAAVAAPRRGRGPRHRRVGAVPLLALPCGGAAPLERRSSRSATPGGCARAASRAVRRNATRRRRASLDAAGAEAGCGSSIRSAPAAPPSGHERRTPTSGASARSSRASPRSATRSPRRRRVACALLIAGRPQQA